MGDTINDGVSHGASIGGYGLGGFGDKGHSGGGANLTYTLGVPLLSGEHRLFLDPSIGLDAGHFTKDYLTPGGESASSAFTRFGGRLGLALRYAPPILDHRLWASIGLGLGMFGFSTPSSASVSTPGNCVPGDFGRADCEPKAGPLTGNAGTSGLWNPKLGSSRGTSGIGLTFDMPLTIGGEILRGAWGNGSLYGFVAPQYTSVSPSDGNGFGSWGIAGGAGMIFRFGGSAVEKQKEVAPPPPPVAQPIEATRTAGEAFTLADEAAVRALGNLDPNAKILGVQFDKLPEDTSAPYEIPASAMTAGKHELKIRYRNPGDVQDKFQTVIINVGEPVKATDNGANYGAVLNMPATATRLTPDMVAGVATERPIPVGNIQTTADFPAKSTYQLYVDGNPVGKPQDLPTDRNTPLTLPATTANGPHQVQLRVMRPNQPTVIYPTVAVTVNPATPPVVKLTSVGAQPRPPAPEFQYKTADLVVDMNSDGEAKEVRIRRATGSSAADVLWSGGLQKGANSATVIGKGAARTSYKGTLIVEQKNGSDWTKIGETQQVDIVGPYTGTWTPPKTKVKL